MQLSTATPRASARTSAVPISSLSNTSHVTPSRNGDCFVTCGVYKFSTSFGSLQDAPVLIRWMMDNHSKQIFLNTDPENFRPLLECMSAGAVQASRLQLASMLLAKTLGMQELLNKLLNLAYVNFGVGPPLRPSQVGHGFRMQFRSILQYFLPAIINLLRHRTQVLRWRLLALPRSIIVECIFLRYGCRGSRPRSPLSTRTRMLRH